MSTSSEGNARVIVFDEKETRSFLHMPQLGKQD
jgi:hypothetical protein